MASNSTSRRIFESPPEVQRRQMNEDDAAEEAVSLIVPILLPCRSTLTDKILINKLMLICFIISLGHPVVQMQWLEVTAAMICQPLNGIHFKKLMQVK